MVLIDKMKLGRDFTAPQTALRGEGVFEEEKSDKPTHPMMKN